ncbi:restriction endonuclease subunit S [Salegentibacter sp. Hel_I_6]|uniref:restriction endonuclease subunit S n=1 Tax=Salegentibacter sp. Hel_I_6 TaxID=1250278 RepID=UPI0006905B40|nr:restriction endonuclease subunit S [Salegentibacter sp. Hel_I_6]
MEKELPKNWIESKLDKVVTSKKGKKPKTLMDSEFKNSVPYLDIRAFEKNEIRRYADIPSSRIIKENQIGIVWDGARSGWVTKGKYGAVGSTIAILDPIGVNENYLLKFLESKFDFLNTNTRGTGIPHVDPKILWDIDIPLPPLPEQKRIVAKLDKLFEQLDVINNSLEKIPVLLMNFRQQVLTLAVTGKLTKSEVEKKELGSLLIEVKYGTSKKSRPDVEGTPVLRIPNIQDGEIYDEDLKYTKLDKKEFEKVKLLPGDVLIIRSNGSVSLVGKSAIVRKKHENFSYAGYLIRLRCKNFLDPEFLNYSLQSNFLRSQIVNTSRSTSGVNNINSSEIKNLKILLPPIEDQKLIVKKVQELFSNVDGIQQKYNLLKNKIENLPQSILHKAFKGELVPQLENDGDARELLEEIDLQTKNIEKKVSTRRKAMKNFTNEYGVTNEKQNIAAETEKNYKE